MPPPCHHLCHTLTNQSESSILGKNWNSTMILSRYLLFRHNLIMNRIRSLRSEDASVGLFLNLVCYVEIFKSNLMIYLERTLTYRFSGWQLKNIVCLLQKERSSSYMEKRGQIRPGVVQKWRHQLLGGQEGQELSNIWWCMIVKYLNTTSQRRR